MAPELRETGISSIGDVPWGTHCCHFYSTKEDLLDVLIPYFKTGLENNEFCVWVVSDPLGEEEARKAFRQAVSGADRYLATGHMEIVQDALSPSSRQTSPSTRIEIVPHTEWYLKDGAFVAERAIDGWNQKLAEALAKGLEGMRVNGNVAWLTEENREDFLQYEKTLDEKLAGQRMIALCSYPLSGSNAAEIFDVARTHQVALVRRQGNWEVLEAPELKQAKAEINRLNEELEQRVVERTKELAAANEQLKTEIAERWRAEDRIRLIIDTIPVMAWSIGPDGIVDFLNQRWVDYAGLSLEQYVADPTGIIHPQDTPRVMERWRAMWALGEGYEDELRLRGADGEYRWFLVRTEPLRDESGEVVKWYGVSTDIEDRKRAEEALGASQARLQAAERLAHIGSWTWDLRTGAVTWSDELLRIYGLQPQDPQVVMEHHNGPPSDQAAFLHPEDRDLAMGTVENARKTGEPYSVYYRILRRGGEERIVHSRGSVVSDELGTPIRMFGATQDVTERKRAEEALKATSEQLRALSGRLQSAKEAEATRIAREIHDELGGALTSLRWDLEEVRDRLSEPADSSQLAALRKKIVAMTTLTKTTIDTVRRLASELRPIGLDELGLVEAIEWQALQFDARTGIAVRYECFLEKVDLNSEQSTAVFRIFQEAMTNILRHAHATNVTITMKQEAGEFSLTIVDNGRGITEKEKSDAHSMGLLGMRERAHLIGARIDVAGLAREGTVVSLRVPIPGSGR